MGLNIKKDAIDFKIKGTGAIPDMISTKEDLNNVSKEGTPVDAMLVKEINESLTALGDLELLAETSGVVQSETLTLKKSYKTYKWVLITSAWPLSGLDRMRSTFFPTSIITPTLYLLTDISQGGCGVIFTSETSASAYRTDTINVKIKIYGIK